MELAPPRETWWKSPEALFTLASDQSHARPFSQRSRSFDLTEQGKEAADDDAAGAIDPPVSQTQGVKAIPDDAEIVDATPLW